MTGTCRPPRCRSIGARGRLAGTAMGNPFRPFGIRDWLLWLGGPLVVLAVPIVFWWRTMWMPGDSFEGALPALTPAQTELARELRRDVTFLADTIGERNLRRPGNLERAATFIEDELRAAGYAPERRTFVVDGQP